MPYKSVSSLTSAEQLQVRQGIDSPKADNTSLNVILAQNPSATRTAISALESNASAVQALIGGANAGNTRTAIGAASSSIYSAAYAARKHVNYVAPFALLKSCLEQKKSADIVILGDSTSTVVGAGQIPWPKRLIDKIVADYTGFGAEYKILSSAQFGAWSSTTLRSASGTPGLYCIPTTNVIPTWADGLLYQAGTFVKHVISGTTYYFFCSQTHTSSSATQPTRASNGPYWRIVGDELKYRVSTEEIPCLYDSGYAISTDPFEMEVDFTFQDANYNNFFYDNDLNGSYSFNFLFGMYGNVEGQRKLPKLVIRTSPTTTKDYAVASAELPITNGDRVRIRVQCDLTRTSGTATMWYQLFNVGAQTWGAWVQCGLVNALPPTQYYKTANYAEIGAGLSRSSTSSIIHGFTVRKTLSDMSNLAAPVNGYTDFDLSVDLYGMFGSGYNAYLHEPTVRVWNSSYGGLRTQNFTKEANFGGVKIDYDKDFPSPSNVALVFINLGHNGHQFPSGKYNSTKLRKLINFAKARFPRAQFCVMSQNPGIDISSIPGAGQQNFEMHESHKALKKSFEAMVCQQDGHAFIDINSVFVDSGEPPTSLSIDGLHPNNAGSELWATALYKIITGTLDV